MQTKLDFQGDLSVIFCLNAKLLYIYILLSRAKE
jgi:hypothetical protein